MKTYEIVAAIVARNSLDRQLSWAELGEIFGQTKDAIRNRVNRFKDKYNVVDSDINKKWSRKFLKAHTPESEKADLNGLDHVPGDVVTFSDENGSPYKAVVISTKGRVVFLDNANEFRTEFWEQADEPAADGKLELEVAQKVQEDVKQIDELKFLITPAVLVVVRDGKPLTIDKTHKNFEKIQKALETKAWQEALDFIDMKTALSKYSNGRVEVKDGSVTLDGEAVAGKIVQRLLTALMEENLEALEGITNFLSNCDKNPDFRIVSRIYDFIAHNDLRLDKEGYILAY